MKILARLLAVVAVAAASWPAAAYNQVVIFGDSLSDSGNNALVIGTDAGQVVAGNSYIPTFAYGSGTYSNADVWATTFAAGLGLQALPSLAGGTNYAYGGAETRSLGYPPSLRAQVDLFAGSAFGDVGDTLFVIAGGGNNARSALATIAGGSLPDLAMALASQRYANDVKLMVDQLQALGAQNIVVWNTPDIGLAPAVQAEGPALALLGTALAANMNLVLSQKLAGETGVTTFDLFGLLGSAVANPAAFGLGNVGDACGAVLGCDPASYLFWDGIHPTSAGHALVADAMFDVLGVTPAVPEPGAAWLLLAGLGVVLLRRRRGAH